MATAATETAAKRKPRGRKKPGPKPGAKAAAAAANGNGNGAPAELKPAAKSTKADPIFDRELNTPAVITASKEVGVIRGRAQYASGAIQYHLTYTSTGGEFRECWIDRDLLSDIPERRKPRTPKVAAA